MSTSHSPQAANGAFSLSVLAQRIEAVPSLPHVVSELWRILELDDVSTANCLRLIESDPLLAGATVKLANSSFYGAPGRIDSVELAVRMLGLRTVTQVLTEAAVRQLMSNIGPPSPRLNEMLNHSVLTATAARELARCYGCQADPAFLAGMLHGMGDLLLLVCFPEVHERIHRLMQVEGADAAAEQREVCGQSWAELSAGIARHWGLPEHVACAIERHDWPVHALGTATQGLPSDELALLLGLAHELTVYLGTAGASGAAADAASLPEDLALQPRPVALGLDQDSLNQVVSRLRQMADAATKGLA